MSIAFPQHVNWQGPNATYRSPRLEDAKEILAILSDVDTMKYLRFMSKDRNGWTLQQVEDRIKDELHGQKENEQLVTHIVCDDKVVGMGGLKTIDTVNRSCRIYIILHKDYWGKNLATEIFYFSLQWAFDELGLHRVNWFTVENNAAMRGWLEKICGLEMECINREVIYVDGEWINTCTYALFEEDWRSRVKTVLESRVFKKLK